MLIESLTSAKNQLSRLIDRVRAGERVRILVHGVPAADLVPVADAELSASAESLGLAALEREGLIRRGGGPAPSGILKPGPRASGTPLSALVAAERDER